MILENSKVLIIKIYYYNLLCDYNDIEAKINGKEFLSLSKDSVKQFGLSADFQILLTKTIEDLVYHLVELHSSFV